MFLHAVAAAERGARSGKQEQALRGMLKRKEVQGRIR